MESYLSEAYLKERKGLNDEWRDESEIIQIKQTLNRFLE